MKLLEYEGKALLARHGVAIAFGALWPQVPASDTGWMIKAQVLAGGRGKRGGILAAQTREEVDRLATKMHGSALGNEPVHAVYVEQKLRVAKEYYLAALVDRDRGRVSVIASAAGGVDIEQVPRSEIARVEVDPLIGLAGFQVQHLRRSLGLQTEAGTQFEDLVRRTVDTLIEEDAELVEINPLILTPEGRWVAADAKVVLDDDAVFRHPDRPGPVAWSTDSKFMQRCRELGVIGVDSRVCVPAPVRPTVALLGNGAGLTMATYDQIALSGVGVAGAIELHGALARGVAHTAEVISHAVSARGRRGLHQRLLSAALDRRAGTGAAVGAVGSASPLARVRGGSHARGEPGDVEEAPGGGRLLLHTVPERRHRARAAARQHPVQGGREMTILVGADSRILVQGITGTTGRLFAEKMVAHGTPLVGGVTPGKGGELLAGVPVFNSMREAVAATGADAVLSCIAPQFVTDGIFEVVDAGIPLVCLYIENIPVHDAIRMCAYAKARGTRMLGPNSAGVVSPGRANMSDLNDNNMRPGRIGIVSKSGTLTYEVIDELHRHGHGESTVVCLGGDRVIGTDYADVLSPVRGRSRHRSRGCDRRAGRRTGVRRGRAGCRDAHAGRGLHHGSGQPAGRAHGPRRRGRGRRRTEPTAEQDAGVLIRRHRRSALGHGRGRARHPNLGARPAHIELVPLRRSHHDEPVPVPRPRVAQKCPQAGGGVWRKRAASGRRGACGERSGRRRGGEEGGHGELVQLGVDGPVERHCRSLQEEVRHQCAGVPRRVRRRGDAGAVGRVGRTHAGGRADHRGAGSGPARALPGRL